MNNPHVKPKPLGLRWAWVCKQCEAPVVVIEGRYFWSCKCHPAHTHVMALAISYRGEIYATCNVFGCKYFLSEDQILKSLSGHVWLPRRRAAQFQQQQKRAYLETFKPRP